MAPLLNFIMLCTFIVSNNISFSMMSNKLILVKVKLIRILKILVTCENRHNIKLRPPGTS